MIETGKVDLEEGFEIQFVVLDCALAFPGYSLRTVPGARDVFHLVKE
jgi:hypothetical protein